MLIILSVLFLGYNTARCNTLNVPDDYQNIQDAISAAGNGDTILVQPGTYHGCIDFTGKNIVVASTWLTSGDTAMIRQTILDGDFLGSVVTISGGITSEAMLCGFTIINGTGTNVNGNQYGGGIFCLDSSPVLDHLRIIGNSASNMGGGVGGGVYFGNSQGTLRNSFLKENSAYYGGGVRVDQSDVTLDRNWFEDNYAVGTAGGLMFFQCPSSYVSRSVFTGCLGIYGGAITCVASSPVIDRVTCFGNGGLYGGSLNVGAECMAYVINSIFWQNALQAGAINEIHIEGYNAVALVANSDIMGGEGMIYVQGTLHWMDGNIMDYPEFADTTGIVLELADGSPCIDAGTDLYIYNNDTIVNITEFSGAAPDMGAFESDQTTGVPEELPEDRNMEFNVLINQGSGSLTVCLEIRESCPVMITVFDLAGRILQRSGSRHIGEGKHEIELSAEYQKGIYIVSVRSGNEVQTGKVFIP